MARPRRSVRLARELALHPAAGLEDQHVNPWVLRHLCEITDERLTSGDRDGLRLARLGCRIAGRLKTDEAHARSFASLASALWLANRLDHAERALEIGFSVGPPPELEGDLLRRRSYIRVYQGRLEDAVRDARQAVGLTTGALQAWSRAVLGLALYYSGEHRAAIDELGRSLADTDPNSETRYCLAIQNYATALAEGTDEEAAAAVELCAEARARLKARHKMQRAKIWWTQGLLQNRLGDPRSAWWSLDTARRSLVALEAAPELAAVVADMARISQKPPAVQHICSEAADVITAHHGLARPFRDLVAAAREMIPEAAAALKAAASQLAPCPAL